MRQAISGPISVPKISGESPINVQLSGQQLRGVQHSCGQAKQVLGYRPVYSFNQSMQAFAAWYRYTQGLDGEFADLLSHLAP